MKNNQELSDLLALDLGINGSDQRPSKEAFKCQNMDLLPYSSTDILCKKLFSFQTDKI